MADDKDSLDKLKDLAQLKGQLEDIQRRVEEEGGSVLASPFLKGFLAGYVVAKLRSSAVLGVAIGACTGIYAAQNFNIPNVEKTVRDYLESMKKRPN